MKIVEKDIIITLENEVYTISGCGSRMMLDKKAFNSLVRAIFKTIVKVGEKQND